ncbi:MAG TPA: hypothetical protein VFI28_11920 [Candidatus Limnocylindrales bacterium]|nr:hypothetical protein [Candidatus Limnocylindrales bacterium]
MKPDDHPIDPRSGVIVPIAAVRDGPRRNVPKVIALVAIAAAIGLVGAGIAGRSATPPTTAIVPNGTGAIPSASARVAAASSAPVPTAADDRVGIPPVPSVELDGAPVLAMWRRDGSDAVVVRWDPAKPDAGLVERERIAELFRDIPADASPLVALSPRAHLVAAAALTSAADGDVERVRVTTLAGKVVWRQTFEDRTLSAPAWNPIRDELVVPNLRSWRIVSFASGTVRVRSVPVPTFEREPIGRVTNPVAPAIVGFSPDGEVAYAAASDSPFVLGLRPLFEVDLAAGRAQEIDRLPPRLADMAASGGSADLSRIDPATGRVFGPPGPGSNFVTVYDRDGVTATSSVGGMHVLAAAWSGDGRLAVLRTNPSADPADPTATTIQLADGSRRPTDILATTRVIDGALLSAPNGYVLAVLAAFGQYELVALRASDGLTAATVIPTDTLSTLRFLGWLPAS